MDKRLSTSPFSHDYFECGAVTGLSGYMNYSWMPELTLRMAHYLVKQLPIQTGETILDFGCAKGFLVKALRILDYEAYGADISEYAIHTADGEIRNFCRLVRGCDDPALFGRPYDWMIAKDVLEHIPESELSVLLPDAAEKIDRLFVVVPVAANDTCGQFVIPEYDRDPTHVVAKSKEWWRGLFQSTGWTVVSEATEFRGCKENWTSKWEGGNAFFVLKSGRG